MPQDGGERVPLIAERVVLSCCDHGRGQAAEDRMNEADVRFGATAGLGVITGQRRRS